jgi:hypothetical protein
MYSTHSYVTSEITHWPLLQSAHAREMENISRGPTFGDFVTICADGSMQDITVARLQIQEYRLPSPPSFICNVLRESLSVDSQNHRVHILLEMKQG